MDMVLVGRWALQLLGCWARSAVQLARVVVLSSEFLIERLPK